MERVEGREREREGGRGGKGNGGGGGEYVRDGMIVRHIVVSIRANYDSFIGAVGFNVEPARVGPSSISRHKKEDDGAPYATTTTTSTTRSVF